MPDPKVTPQIQKCAEAIVNWLSNDNTLGTDASDEELIEKFSASGRFGLHSRLRRAGGGGVGGEE